MNRYNTTPISTLAPNASATVNTTTAQLDFIPPVILLAARIQDSSQSFATSDTQLAITNLNVSWNGNSGLLSNASQVDLFKIAHRNGFNGSWDQFVFYTGGVIPLVPVC